MTLVWEYYKLVQGTYCIDNIDQAQNSYDQEKPRIKNIQKTRNGGSAVSVAPFWNTVAPPTLKCPWGTWTLWTSYE